MSVTYIPYNPWKEQLLGQIGTTMLSHLMKSGAAKATKAELAKAYGLATEGMETDTVASRTEDAEREYWNDLVRKGFNAATLQDGGNVPAEGSLQGEPAPGATPLGNTLADVGGLLMNGTSSGMSDIPAPFRPGGTYSKAPPIRQLNMNSISDFIRNNPEQAYKMGEFIKMMPQLMTGMAGQNEQVIDADTRGRMHMGAPLQAQSIIDGDTNKAFGYNALMDSTGVESYGDVTRQEKANEGNLSVQDKRNEGIVESIKLKDDLGAYDTQNGYGNAGGSVTDFVKSMSYKVQKEVDAYAETHPGMTLKERQVMYNKNLAQGILDNYKRWGFSEAQIKPLIDDFDIDPAPKFRTLGDESSGVQFVEKFYEKNKNKLQTTKKNGTITADNLQDMLWKNNIRAPISVINAMTSHLNSLILGSTPGSGSPSL